MVTPDNLYDILCALKDAGVSRAKLGDCEFEFPVEQEAPVELPKFTFPGTGELRAPQSQVAASPTHKQAGYESLFPSPPRFEPAEQKS